MRSSCAAIAGCAGISPRLSSRYSGIAGIRKAYSSRFSGMTGPKG